MDDRTIKIEADMTFEELHRQNKYQLYSSKLYKVSLVILYLMLVVVIVLLILDKELLFSTVFFGLYVLFPPVSDYLTSKRLFKDLKGNKAYSISNNGFIYDRGDGKPSERYKWANLQKVLESEEAFLFFPNDNMYSYFFMIDSQKVLC